MILRESIYHRNFREDESLPRIPIWKLDNEADGKSINDMD